MAEVLFREYLKESSEVEDWWVDSAGVWAIDGEPATLRAQKVVKERGLDLSSHRSQPISHRLLENFDLVLVMEDRHRKTLKDEHPEFADRIYLLTEMVGEERNIEDPVWGTEENYRETVRELIDIFERGLDRIQSLVGR
jgi:protein-tyrosine-phosphatase